MKRLMVAVVMLCGIAAAEEFPLMMTAVFTEGKGAYIQRDFYHSGDYECVSGDEHNAPICHTLTEWSQLDRMRGTPDTVLFTLADGSQVGVQSATIHKIDGYVVCDPGTRVVFCSLYFDMLPMLIAPSERRGKFGQVEYLSGEEQVEAQRVLHKKLFGDSNQMSTTFSYKLKGKPQNGFQRIEVAGVDSGLIHLLNPLGDGYYLGTRY